MEAHVNILTKLLQFNKLEANLAPLLTKASKKAITEAMYRSSFRKNCSNLALIKTINLAAKSKSLYIALY